MSLEYAYIVITGNWGVFRTSHFDGLLRFAANPTVGSSFDIQGVVGVFRLLVKEFFIIRRDYGIVDPG